MLVVCFYKENGVGVYHALYFIQFSNEVVVLLEVIHFNYYIVNN